MSQVGAQITTTLPECDSNRPDELAGYFTAGILAVFDGIDCNVHRQVSDGTLVMNERTDVVDGRIAAWRDYFDMETITSAFG